MKDSIFGTDGIRGLVNRYPVTAEIALKIGMAIGIYVEANKSIKRVVIAKDTRLSGYMIESALASGLISNGVNVILVGPMPTPSISMLIKSLRADFGIMITASHNPYHDNGVKLFNRKGYKLNKDASKEIENLIFDNNLQNNLAAPSKLGKAIRLEDAPGRYIEHVKKSFSKSLTLSNLKIAIDCANGSAYKLAPTILWELGAEIITLGCKPNGFNINENCGSIYPQNLCKKVQEGNADIGIALDGDADRVVICDENGKIIDGDHIIGMIAKHLKENHKLEGNAIVVTKVSNGALEEYLNSINIKTIYTDVGDIKVYEQIKRNHLNFGGEESGHIIFTDYSNTGDGTISALQILEILGKSKKKLSELANIFALNPRVKANIPFKNHDPLQKEAVNNKLNNIMSENSDLKIVVRKSGTEDLIRVSVEGKQKDKITQALKQITGYIEGCC